MPEVQLQTASVTADQRAMSCLWDLHVQVGAISARIRSIERT
jgi:hypothetical protein